MLRILVVEDNPDLRETLALLLEGDHRHVESAANAEDALRLYTAQPFDVVFSDVKLPGMSGLELAEHLRASRPSPWIVMSSGAAVPELPPEAKARTRFLGKPFAMETLDALLREFEGAR